MAPRLNPAVLARIAQKQGQAAAKQFGSNKSSPDRKRRRRPGAPPYTSRAKRDADA